MMESSAEYRAVIDLTSELRLAVRPELISLTGSLLASRLISPGNDIELRDTAHSGEAERSARLVELIQNKVRQNPHHYHSFIGILQGNKDQYGDILQRLEQAYQKWQRDGNDINIMETANFNFLPISCLYVYKHRNLGGGGPPTLKIVPIDMNRHKPARLKGQWLCWHAQNIGTTSSWLNYLLMYNRYIHCTCSIW